MKQNSWLVLGGIALIVVLLIVGYQVISVKVGPVEVGLQPPGNGGPAPQTPQVKVRPTATPRPIDPTDEPTPTPVGIRNPSGTISCTGMPIIVDDYSLSVDGCAISTHGDYVSVNLTIRNIGERQRTFRYLPIAVTLLDDVGTVYKRNSESSFCEEADLYSAHQVDIRANQKTAIYSENYGGWCVYGYTFPQFVGPIPANAKKLSVEFNDFGPFTGFSIEIVP